LLANLDALKAQRDEVKADLETEREARRRLQRTIRDGKPNQPRFVLLILHLDADIFLFDDQWITGDPANGGEKIAVELISKVTSYIQSILELSSNVQVIVKIYGDLFKLWRAYEAAGINLGSSDLTRFFSHFNRKDSLVDFVDFGPRKGSIERKLSGILGHHLSDDRVEHIILGSPHTSLPTILAPHDALLYTSDQKSRLSLLTVQPNPKDWADLGYTITSHFDSFFYPALPASSAASSNKQVKVHSKSKPPPAAPVPPQAANVPRLRIRREVETSPEWRRDEMRAEPRGMGGSYPPSAGGYMPIQSALSRRDTFPRYTAPPPPAAPSAPPVPSLHWP